MKIVMVGDCAYVGYELKRELEKRGIQVQHLRFRVNVLDVFRMALKLRNVKADLIHAHYCRGAAYACYFSGVPYITHCHGSDVRKGLNWVQRLCLNRASKILVATPDLLKILPNATYLPTPVGPQFRDLGFPRKGAVYFRKWYEKPPENTPVPFKILESTVPYKDMPELLNQFEYFIEQHISPILSKTALEALACGCKVVNLANQILEGLPEQHKVENVVDKLLEIYLDVTHQHD